MRIWALSDLHLSLGTDKPMDIFGDHWVAHHERMATAWDAAVADDDIVLTPGDFSWAGKTAEAAADFAWLAERPGFKVLVKGNHDHWWPRTKKKLAEALPERTWALKKTGAIIQGIGFFGARGGDFAPLTRYGDERSQAQIDAALDKEEKELLASIADLERLEQKAGTPCRGRICCFHYPPVAAGKRQSRFTSIITDSGASHCIYGHLHGQDLGPAKVEGDIDGVTYRCMSCDQIDFTPALVAEYL
jgi:predicted phosphohydrolase